MKRHNAIFGSFLAAGALVGSAFLIDKSSESITIFPTEQTSTQKQYVGGVQHPRESVKPKVKKLKSSASPTPRRTVTPSPSPTPSTRKSPSPSPSASKASPTPYVTQRPEIRPNQGNGKLIQGEGGFYYDGLSKSQVHDIEHCGNDSEKILFTFDDVGSPQRVDKIASYLVKNKYAAIFFINKSPTFSDERIARLRQQGLYVANHTRDHENLSELYDAGKADHVKTQMTDNVKSNIMRPPFGGSKVVDGKDVFDNRILQTANSIGQRVCDWTNDSEDWKGENASVVRKRVADQLEPGDVVLMHDLDHSNILGALPGIAEDIKSRDLEVCALSKGPVGANVPDSIC